MNGAGGYTGTNNSKSLALKGRKIGQMIQEITSGKLILQVLLRIQRIGTGWFSLEIALDEKGRGQHHLNYTGRGLNQLLKRGKWPLGRFISLQGQTIRGKKTQMEGLVGVKRNRKEAGKFSCNRRMARSRQASSASETKSKG